MKGSSRPGSAPAFSSGSLRASSMLGGGQQAAPFLMQKGFTSGRPVAQSMSQMFPMSQSQPAGAGAAASLALTARR
jgi:hypothetical protein